uniref:Peptidylglycine alpha-amidating monooxygenase n=1 Tax=Meleagris gallopavo TaxID=9103 RepID=A0A803XMK0_MELGA
MAGLINNLLILILVLQSICLGFRSSLSVFKRYKDATRSLSSECFGSTRPVISFGLSDFALDIRMPGVTPKQSDTYLCMSVPLPVDDEAYVVDFKPHASMDTVHHMLLFGCNEPSSNENYWDCDEGICKDKSNILYAWARNAPPTRLPKGVGFRVGGETGSKFFVLQVHYGDISAFRDKHKDCSGVTLHLTHQKQPLIAGMYLMMSVNTVIPPGEKVVDADIACHYKRFPMHLFAYRVHTHRLGKVVSGYRVRNGQWTLIGRQSPQVPQAFYPVEHPVDVSYDDILAARCVFSGEGRTTETHIGGTANDEMCNFYIMYYMEAKHAVSYTTCTQNANPEMFRNIPEEANIPIPVKPDMLKMAHGHHEETKDTDKSSLQLSKGEEEEILDQSDFYSLLSKLLGEREDVVHVHKQNPTEKAESDLVAEIANVVQKKDLAREITDHERDSTVLVRDRIHKFHRLESTLRPPENKQFPLQQPKHGEGSWEKENTGDFHIEEAMEWPGLDLKLGQVSGLALDPENNVVIFHRGDHVWDEKLRQNLPKLLQQLQRNCLQARHVTLHLSSAVQPRAGSHRVMVLQQQHCSRVCIPQQMLWIFCFAETSSGKAGPGQFRIPHSLALIPELSQLCVADRENGRIQCFRLETGEFVREIKHKSFGRELFAVSYSPGGLLFAVNGMPYPGESEPVQGFVMNFSTGEIIDSFIPLRKSFEMPHDIVASEDKTVFVGDVHARTVWKFASTESMFFLLLISHPDILSDGEHKLDSNSGRILGRLRGKGGGGLNLGNFFASHKGYSRKGFDRVSTEGSDQEKDEDDGTDSEEEYSAPAPPQALSSS